MANYNPSDARATAIFSKRTVAGGKELLVPAKFRLIRYNVDAVAADNSAQLIETLPNGEQGFGDTGSNGGELPVPIEGLEVSGPLPFSAVFKLD